MSKSNPELSLPAPESGRLIRREDLAAALAAAKAPPPTVVPPHAPVPLGDPPGLNRVATPGALVRSLGRCWRLAVPVGLVLAAGLGAAVWTLRPDKVTATALVRVAPASATRVLRDTSVVENSTNDTNYMRTQMALLRSRPVLRATLKDEKIRQSQTLSQKPDSVEWLEKELLVQQVEGTELVRLALTGRGDGSDFGPILNAVIAAYLEAVDKTEHANQLKSLDELQKIHAAAEDKVRQLRASLSALTRDLKGADAQVLSLKQRTLIEEYGSQRRDLGVTNTRRRELEVKLANLKHRQTQTGTVQPAGGVPDQGATDLLVERDVDADPRVQAQQAKVARLQESLDLIRERVASPDSPVVVKARQDLEAADQLLQTARAERRKAATARLQTFGRAAVDVAVREIEVELAALTKQRDALETESAALKKDIERLGLDSVDLELKRSEVERSEGFSKAIWEQKERLDVELKGSRRQRVSVLAPAEDATVLNRMGRAQEATGAALGGLLAGLVGVSLWEHRRGRIHHSTDVSRGLRLPVVGALPAFKPEALASGVRLTGGLPGQYAPGLVESVDGIRTMLLHGRFGVRCPVIMVSSPSAGEGKSTLAAQLALSLARGGYRTLLADGDLRCPSLHRAFDLPQAPGVCELLAGAVSLDAAVQPGPIDGLDLLTAGDFSPQAAAGLAQQRLLTLASELRGRYDFVLLDSSPLLLVPDGFMLGRCVDGVVFSVRPGVSRAADVYAGYERACEHHLPFVGVVMNGVARGSAYAQSPYIQTAATAGGPPTVRSLA